jgi:hypothetical protein
VVKVFSLSVVGSQQPLLASKIKTMVKTRDISRASIPPSQKTSLQPKSAIISCFLQGHYNVPSRRSAFSQNLEAFTAGLVTARANAGKQKGPSAAVGAVSSLN